VKASSLLPNNLIIPQNLDSVNASLPKYLKSFSELNISALYSHQDKELYTFYLLKYLNCNGSGIIRYKTAIKGMLTIFNISKSSAYDQLAKGIGLFWTECYDKKGSRCLKLLSYQKIAEYFGIKYLGRSVLIPISQCVSRQSKRAFMYSTQFKNTYYNKLVHPESRGQLQQITNVSPTTQRKYDKISKTKTTKNYSDEIIVYEGKIKEYYCRKQLPNSYHARLLKGNKGRIRTINKSLKQNRNLSCTTGAAKDTDWPRRFFDTPKAFLKCKNREVDTYIPKRQGKYENVWEKVS
jgi:hypothetical protein